MLFANFMEGLVALDGNFFQVFRLFGRAGGG